MAAARNWSPGRAIARLGATVCIAALAGCATVPDQERLLAAAAGGEVVARTAVCGTPAAAGPSGAADASLPAAPLRVLSWNLHKGEDDGWDRDLARYAAEHDVLLLQEAVLTPALRAVVERAGMRWLMAGAFSMDGIERGVMIAARAAPLAGCTLRSFEPLFPVPKSAMVVRYRLASGETVAVANLHGINFTLGLGRFTEQLRAVADELKRHAGPIVFGGDFNTWSEQRHDVMLEVARELGLTPVVLTPDGRRRHFGQLLDHFFVRGLTVRAAASPEVKSSDHNPILVTLVHP